MSRGWSLPSAAISTGVRCSSSRVVDIGQGRGLGDNLVDGQALARAVLRHGPQVTPQQRQGAGRPLSSSISRISGCSVTGSVCGIVTPQQKLSAR